MQKSCLNITWRESCHEHDSTEASWLIIAKTIFDLKEMILFKSLTIFDSNKILQLKKSSILFLRICETQRTSYIVAENA